MKEKPILFSSEMVRAILAGNKTLTRIAIEPVPENATAVTHNNKKDRWYWWDTRLGDEIKSPYQIGDLLWVQEAFSEGLKRNRETGKLEHYQWNYRAEEERHSANGVFIQGKRKDGKPIETMADLIEWKPAESMPREASRITLGIVSVRVERLQDISEEDAIAEGIEVDEMGHAVRSDDEVNWGSAKGVFADTWDKINGKKYPWESNPWVWRIEFEKV